MKKSNFIRLSFTIIFCLACVLLVAACKKKTQNSNTTAPSSQTTKEEEKHVLSPTNFKVDDNYMATWTKVQDATSYTLKVGNTEIEVGDVDTYDLSQYFGESVKIKANSNKEDVKDSKYVEAVLNNYTYDFSGFEDMDGEDDYSAAYLGSTILLGNSEDFAHSGKTSFKVLQNGSLKNASEGVGGIFFDAGYYGYINLSELKSISFWTYIDNTKLDDVEALATLYEDPDMYNAEFKDFTEIKGALGFGYVSVFYMDELGKEKEALLNGGVTLDDMLLNKWHQVTIDVSGFENITGFIIRTQNSPRTMLGLNTGAEAEWHSQSGYSYFQYFDDITVTYKEGQLSRPENVQYADNELSWDEVPNATYYEVSTDNNNFTKVYDTAYEVNGTPEFLIVRAANDKKYSDGLKQYKTSMEAYVNAENASALSLEGTTFELVKQTNAAVLDTLTWTAVENANAYAVSADKVNWDVVDADNLSYDITTIEQTDKIYFKAISYRYALKDSEIKEIAIAKKVTVAGEFENNNCGFTKNNGYDSIKNDYATKSKYGSSSYSVNVISRSTGETCAYDFYINDTKFNYVKLGGKNITALTMWVYVEADFEKFYTVEACASFMNWSSGISGSGAGTVKEGGYPTNTWVQLKLDYTNLGDFVNAYGLRGFIYTSEKALNGNTNGGSTQVTDANYTVYFDEVQLWYNDPVKVEFFSDDAHYGADVEASIGWPIAKPEDPEKEGYIFVGWLDEENNPYNFDTKLTGSLKLYALFRKADAPKLATPTDLVLSKGEGAVVNNILTWTAVENVEYYEISSDLENWTNIGNVTTFDYTGIYNAQYLYVRALPTPLSEEYQASDAAKIKIEKKARIASESTADIDTADAVLPKNATLSNSTDIKKYGDGAIKLTGSKATSGYIAYKLAGFKDANNGDQSLTGVCPEEITGFSVWLYVESESFETFTDLKILGFRIMNRDTGSNVLGNTTGEFKTGEWFQVYVPLTFPSGFNPGGWGHHIRAYFDMATLAEGAEFTAYIDEFVFYCDETVKAPTNLALTKSEGAVVNNVLTWTKAANAKGYEISADGVNWTNIGDVDSFDYTNVYGVQALYLRSIRTGANEVRSEAVTIDIDKKVRIATESIADIDTADAVLPKNATLSNSTDIKKYGDGAIKLTGSKTTSGYIAYKLAGFKDTTMGDQSLAGVKAKEITGFSVWLYVESESFETFTDLKILGFRIMNRDTGSNVLGNTTGEFKTGEWFQVYVPLTFPSGFNPGGWGHHIRGYFDMSTLADGAEFTAYIDEFVIYCNEVIEGPTNLALSKSEGAVVNNVLTWNALEGATEYQVSTDGTNYTSIGTETSYDYSLVYNVGKLYVRAKLENGFTAASEIAITKKTVVAHESNTAEIDMADAVLPKNTTISTSTEVKKYGESSIMIAASKATTGYIAYKLATWSDAKTGTNAFKGVDPTKITGISAWIYVDTENFETLTDLKALGFKIMNRDAGNLTISSTAGEFAVGEWVQIYLDLTYPSTGFQVGSWGNNIRAYFDTSSIPEGAEYTFYIDEFVYYYN